MSDSSTQPPHQGPTTGERLMFLLVALVQIPFGLVTLQPEHLTRIVTDRGVNIQWSHAELVILIIMAACCLFAGIGLTGGLHTRRVGAITIGLAFGIVFALVDFWVMGFLGCGVSLLNL